MLTTLLLSLSLALPSAVESTPHRRQSDGAVSESIDYRRGYHSSTILSNIVYIDGGQFSYSSDESITYDYSTTLLSIDLANDWTNDTLTVESVNKPPGVPDLVRGGLWADSTNNLLYNGFAGDISSQIGDEEAQAYGLWSYEPLNEAWTNLNASASATFQTEPRPFSGSVATGNGTGYYLGGYIYDSNGNKTAISGLLAYDFSSNTLTNKTVSGTMSGGMVQKGRMIYVPNFGTNGVLISLGGYNEATAELYSMSHAEIYDPDGDVWYQQATTGDAPEPRIEFCIAGAASTNRTFDIFVYAGWDNADASSAYDEVFILSLPSFQWFKADYESEHPRHGLTCEHVGGGQILTIGGVDSSAISSSSSYEAAFSTPDQFKQGLAIFDMSTLSFKSSYTSGLYQYAMSDTVQNYYDTNDRDADFSTTSLKNLFAVEHFNTTTANATTTNASTTPSKSNTGVIIGGVVGGVALVALVAGLAFFLFRRRRRRAQAAKVASKEADSYLMRDYDKAVGINRVHQELPPSVHDRPAASEAHGIPLNEAPSGNIRPTELP
ncbi:hypothetical protein N0V82_004336 [Gnomoniopsis sp. IMI 355080]|nr:hypothetical protein N0V82_004336 [Gnomoniopsis sp. IMI 355080]